MRSHLKHAGWFLLVTGLLGCGTDPQIEGNTRLVVGQRITLELQSGPDFLANELSLTDSAGKIYTAADALLEYQFGSGKDVTFSIPHGIAAGRAQIAIAAQGREPYAFDVIIVRLLGLLGVSGTLELVDLSAPGTVFATGEAGAGGGSLSLSPSGDRVAAIEAASGEIHFLSLSSQGFTSFAPPLALGMPLGRGVLLDRGILVAANNGVAHIVQQAGALVLDRWLETGPTRSVSAAPALARAIAVGTDPGQGDVMVRLNLALSPPDISGDPLLLGGSAGGVRDGALSPGGDLGVTVNQLDSTVTSVPVASPTPLVNPVALPAGDVGPTRVVFSPDGTWLAVACADSRSVAIYNVFEGALTHAGSVQADPRSVDALIAKAPVDLGFAPGRALYVLLADGALGYIDLNVLPAQNVLLRDGQESGGAALFVQP
jgi:hypothetical protein